MYRFTIKGKLPGMNEYTAANRRNRYAGAQMKQDAQKYILTQIRQQMRGIAIDRPVRIHYRWFESNKRRDHDNVSGFGHKVIQDALVSAGVLKNDGWNDIVGYTDVFFVDRENPRIEVELEVV